MPFIDPQVIDLLAPRVQTHLIEYHQAQDPAMRHWYHEQLVAAIRCLDLFIAPRVSKRVQYLADESVDGPSLYASCSRPGLVGMREWDNIFVLDCVYPVSQMANDLLRLDTDDLGAIHALLSQTEFAWIMPNENIKLNSLGYHQYRPDPYRAYEEAGIDLVPLCIAQVEALIGRTCVEVAAPATAGL